MLIAAIILIAFSAYASVCICLAYAAEHTPVTPELPKPPEGAHGAYVESEHERFQRESYVKRHDPKQITSPSLVNAILAEHNEARRKDGKIG